MKRKTKQKLKIERKNKMEREINEYKEKELKRRVAMAEVSKETCNILIEYLKEIMDTKRERTANEIDSVPAVALAIFFTRKGDVRYG